MTRRFSWFTLLFLGLQAALPPAVTPQGLAKKKVSLQGYVYDSKRAPVVGADVTVWVVGRKDRVGSTRTAKDGKYKLDVEVSDAFDIAYSKSKFRMSVVTHLAEQKDHQISRVLYARGERIPAAAAHAYAQSLDRVVFLATSLPALDRKSFMAKFEDVGEGVHLGTAFEKFLSLEDSSPEARALLRQRFKSVGEALLSLSKEGIDDK